jgi:hypothetical protein
MTAKRLCCGLPSDIDALSAYGQAAMQSVLAASAVPAIRTWPVRLADGLLVHREPLPIPRACRCSKCLRTAGSAFAAHAFSAALPPAWA